MSSDNVEEAISSIAKCSGAALREGVLSVNKKAVLVFRIFKQVSPHPIIKANLC